MASPGPCRVWIIRALLLVEFDDLDRIAGQLVLELAADATQGGFDGNDAARIVDGVCGLSAGRCHAHELRRRSEFRAGQVDLERLWDRGCVDDLEVELLFGRIAGD